VEGAGRAAASCVVAVANMELGSLGLPLIGAGSAGLEPAAVADAIVVSVRTAIRDLPADTPLRAVVFFVENEDAAELVESAWQGYRSQPFANDRAGGPDLLGVRDEVEALAEMLLLRDVQPPLAVGILGGWGSGKSFVMHLMRDRLDEIRAATLAETECWDGDRVSPFVGHVYPIDFNAWTYARADLWAALMQSTLTELDRQLGLERRLVTTGHDLRDGTQWRRLLDLPAALQSLYQQSVLPDGTEDLFATLNRIHESDRKAFDETQTRLADLRAMEVQAETEVEAQVDAELAVPVDAARWAPFRALVASTVGAGAEDIRKWIAKEAPETTQVVDGVTRTTQDAREVAAALQSLRPPDRTVAKSVIRRHWGAAFVFLLASAVLPVVLVRARHWLHEYSLSAGLVTAIAGVASFARLVAGWMAVVRHFTNRIVVWQRAVDEDVRRIEETRPARVDATKRADPRLSKVRDEIARTTHELDRLRQKVGLVGEFRSVGDLVKERLESGTYQQRLGVMQQISEDLASLSRSLTTSDRDVDRDAKRLLFPRGPARVVLFIDDLDRCPPGKVVEVLEAVQLLLATNLFVVVIALDVRYVTKALEKVYEGVLEADGEPSGLDYLEKIIQIPYRTRRLTTGPARRFLLGQLRVVPADGDPADYGPRGDGMRAARGDDPLPTPTPRTSEAIARDLVFTQDDVEVLAVCCTVLAVSPRAGKRVANIVKLFRMAWARRARPAPTLDETATVALLVALAASHPEVQRDALVRLDEVIRATPPRGMTLAEALLSLPEPAETESPRWRRQHATWRAALIAAGEEPVFDDGPQRMFRLSAAVLADVTGAVEFVAAFCFVADTTFEAARPGRASGRPRAVEARGGVRREASAKSPRSPSRPQ
jgi:hypothetical protein